MVSNLKIALSLLSGKSHLKFGQNDTLKISMCRFGPRVRQNLAPIAAVAKMVTYRHNFSLYIILIYKEDLLEKVINT